MDLNTVAFCPSACIPFIPNTDRNDKLNMYGDADVTVSVFRLMTPPVTVGRALAGAF